MKNDPMLTQEMEIPSPPFEKFKEERIDEHIVEEALNTKAISTHLAPAGTKKLLTREEETALGRRIDAGNRIFRRSLKIIDQIFKKNNIDGAKKVEYGRTIQSLRSLKGFSEPDLDRFESIISQLTSVSKLRRSAQLELKETQKHIRLARIDFLNAKNVFVERNLGLVTDIAKRYLYRGLDLSDLFQEGSCGLLKAVERFEYRRGLKFSTYATWWIRQAIIRAIANQNRTIRVPVHMHERKQKVERCRTDLRQRLEREPNHIEIRSEMDRRGYTDVATVNDLKKLELSFDDLIPLDHTFVEDGEPLSSAIADPNTPSPFGSAASAEIKKMTEREIAKLSHREAKILGLRFGLCGRDFTLDDVGQTLGITRERIRQIEKKALGKLRINPKLRALVEV